MKIKNLLILGIGAGAGYLFGTRQGRVKLEQFKAQAASLAHDPRVQSGAANVAEQVSKQAHHLPQPVQNIVKAATDQVQNAVHRAQEPGSATDAGNSSTSGTGTSGAADTGTPGTGTADTGTPGTSTPSDGTPPA